VSTLDLGAIIERMKQLAIQLRPLKALIPYARNARTHSAKQIDEIAQSVRRFGWTNPILLDGDSGVLAGHGRILAAEKLGLVEVPCVDIGHLSASEKRAYVIADNKLAENAGWNDDVLRLELGDLKADGFDLSELGFSDIDLGRLFERDESAGLTDPDAVPEPEATPTSRRGDLWLLGEHRLLCGDSTDQADVERVMNGERAVLFATDPPYLVDYTGMNHPSKIETKAKNKDWRDKYGKTWDESKQGVDLYENFIRVAIAAAITPNAAWYCWHAAKRQAMVEGCWEKFGVLMHQQIIWNKNKPVLTYSHYMWKHEPCFYGWLRGNEPAKVSGDYPVSVWDVDVPSIFEKTDHPTSKPVELFAIPMRQHSKPGEVCYEPFAGSGSQYIAGEMTKSRVYGLEISETFCDVIVRRWEQFTGQRALLDGDGRSFAAIQEERTRRAA
jgi:DNA modification methylase